MRKITDEGINEIKRVFNHICENILDIPKDAITVKRDGDTCGIYCTEEYFKEFSDFMESLEGWEPVR